MTVPFCAAGLGRPTPLGLSGGTSELCTYHQACLMDGSNTTSRPTCTSEKLYCGNNRVSSGRVRPPASLPSALVDASTMDPLVSGAGETLPPVSPTRL